MVVSTIIENTQVFNVPALINSIDVLPKDLALVPIVGKRPYHNEWSQKDFDREFIKAEILLGKQATGIGLKTGEASGGILAVDFDGSSAFTKMEELAQGRELPKAPSFTSGKPGREQRLFYIPWDCWEGLKGKRVFPTGVEKEQLELRWNGHQSALPYSQHPETGVYFWKVKIADYPIPQAPTWLVDLLREHEQSDDSERAHRPIYIKPNGASALSELPELKEVAKALYLLPLEFCGNYDTWLQAGMALHTFGDEGLELWEAWSQQSDKYQPGICESKWNSFKRDEGGITIASIFHWAKDYGWIPPEQVKQNEFTIDSYRAKIEEEQRKLTDLKPFVTEYRNERYLNIDPATIQPGILAVESPPGTAKTTFAKGIVKRFKAEGIGVNIFGHRNSLLRQFCEATGALFVWDEDQNTWLQVDAITACSVESNEKYPNKPVVIVEEGAKVLQQLFHSSTCKQGRTDKISAFEEHLKQAEYIIVLDADLKAVHLQYLAEITGKPLTVIKNEYKFEDNWTVHMYQGTETKFGISEHSPSSFDETMLNSYIVGGKPAVVGDSRVSLEAIEHSFNKACPDRVGLRVDSETSKSDPRVLEFLANPNEWILKNKPEYLILSPTAEASLDVTVRDYFTEVWGRFTGVINHASARQMLARVRDSIDRHVFIVPYSQNDNTASRSPMPKVVHKHLFLEYAAICTELAMVDYMGEKDSIAAIQRLADSIDSTSKEWTNKRIKFFANTLAMDNYSRANLRPLLAKSLEEFGHNVIMLDIEQSDGIGLKDIRDDIHEEKGQAIATAKDISIETAKSMKQRPDLTLEEERQVQKAFLQARVPGFPLTADFITEYYLKDRDFLAQQERRYLLDHPEISFKRDRQTMKGALTFNVQLWDINTNALLLKAAKELDLKALINTLKNTNNTLLNDGYEWDKNSEFLDDILQKCLQNKDLTRQALGINIKPDYDKVKLFSKILNKFGIPIITRKSNGNRLKRIDRAELNSELYTEIYEALSRRFEEKSVEKEIQSEFEGYSVPVPIEQPKRKESETAKLWKAKLRKGELYSVLPDELLRAASTVVERVGEQLTITSDYTPTLASNFKKLAAEVKNAIAEKMRVVNLVFQSVGGDIVKTVSLV